MSRQNNYWAISLLSVIAGWRTAGQRFGDDCLFASKMFFFWETYFPVTVDRGVKGCCLSLTAFPVKQDRCLFCVNYITRFTCHMSTSVPLSKACSVFSNTFPKCLCLKCVQCVKSFIRSLIRII